MCGMIEKLVFSGHLCSVQLEEYMQWGATESTMFSDHFCIVIEHFLSGGMYHREHHVK